MTKYLGAVKYACGTGVKTFSGRLTPRPAHLTPNAVEAREKPQKEKKKKSSVSVSTSAALVDEKLFDRSSDRSKQLRPDVERQLGSFPKVLRRHSMGVAAATLGALITPQGARHTGLIYEQGEKPLAGNAKTSSTPMHVQFFQHKDSSERRCVTLLR
ncbi:hypothetical protein HPB50_020216 [Hyalomma asiaticum]|uniref:Uncharacterized protein n=1 Tax=Hyalomma asiaticum TaxID=266040 RepID=A0ACB7TAR8_HYAAI|nr:hypothetical protein HPB50_020216 [Hyalomma asiaticum]